MLVEYTLLLKKVVKVEGQNSAKKGSIYFWRKISAERKGGSILGRK